MEPVEGLERNARNRKDILMVTITGVSENTSPIIPYVVNVDAEISIGITLTRTRILLVTLQLSVSQTRATPTTNGDLVVPTHLETRSTTTTVFGRVITAGFTDNLMLKEVAIR